MNYDNWEEREKKFAPDQIPGTITREIYVHYEADGRISIWDCDISNSKRVLLCKQTVKVKIPRQDDLREKMIEAIENEIETLQAETHKKVSELKAKVNALLCIEYKAA